MTTRILGIVVAVACSVSGTILGKRCGTTENIGFAAREQSPKN